MKRVIWSTTILLAIVAIVVSSGCRSREEQMRIDQSVINRLQKDRYEYEDQNRNAQLQSEMMRIARERDAGR